jgi:hypothetical protein
MTGSAEDWIACSCPEARQMPVCDWCGGVLAPHTTPPRLPAILASLLPILPLSPSAFLLCTYRPPLLLRSASPSIPRDHQFLSNCRQILQRLLCSPILRQTAQAYLSEATVFLRPATHYCIRHSAPRSRSQPRWRICCGRRRTKRPRGRARRLPTSSRLLVLRLTVCVSKSASTLSAWPHNRTSRR